MHTESLILVNEFCTYHHVGADFVLSLEQRGLIETTTVAQTNYVRPDQLTRLEKFVRLHQELAIHTDDLDIVVNLLDRLTDLQTELTRLQNRLRFYEPAGE